MKLMLYSILLSAKYRALSMHEAYSLQTNTRILFSSYYVWLGRRELYTKGGLYVFSRVAMSSELPCTSLSIPCCLPLLTAGPRWCYGHRRSFDRRSSMILCWWHMHSLAIVLHSHRMHTLPLLARSLMVYRLRSCTMTHPLLWQMRLSWRRQNCSIHNHCLDYSRSQFLGIFADFGPIVVMRVHACPNE